MFYSNLPPSTRQTDFLVDALIAGTVAIDTETNGKDCRDGRGYCQGISIAYRKHGELVSGYFPVRHDDVSLSMGERREVLELLTKVKEPVFHNAKFDLQVLLNEGCDLTGSAFQDTMLMAHLIDENYPMSKSLEMVSKYYLKIDNGTHAKAKDTAFANYTKKSGWVMPAGMMQEYARVDTELTLRVWETLQGKITPALRDDIWPVRRKVVALLRRMESNGVLINQELCRKMTTIGETQLDELTTHIGGNLGSPLFLKATLLGELGLPVVKWNKPNKKGVCNPSFDKEAMLEYEQLLSTMDNPLAQQVFAYRGWQKSVSSNYRAYLDLVSPDGRLRPNYKMHGTRTGRLSCEKPNLQQIPKVSDKPWNGAMKACFVQTPGYTLIEADYSQLELRLATAYGRVTDLQEVFLQGRDVFTEMSKELGMTRQDTKTLVYSIQYGAGIPRICHVFGVTEARASEIREEFYTKYPGFRTTSELAKKAARNTRKVPIWTGRERHFTRDDNPGKAFNSMIQGGAADIVERSMLRVEESMASNDCRMLLQVHDSIVLEVKDELVEDAKKEVVSIMEAVTPDFGVKFAVEVKKWGQ